MNLPLLQPCPVPPRPHWTEPVSREETLARREKFQKISWFAPNYEPKTKKVIVTAKRLWDKYVIRAAAFACVMSRCVWLTVCLSGIVSILVSMPIHTFWKAGITTLNPGLIRPTIQLRGRRTIV
jgi:hypothetical protein